MRPRRPASTPRRARATPSVSLAGLTFQSGDGQLSPRDEPVITGATVARLLAFAEAVYPAWQSWLRDSETTLRQLRGTRDLVAALSMAEQSVTSDVPATLDALEELLTVLRAKLEASLYSEDTLAQRYTVTIPAVPGAPSGRRRGAA